jgi:hypothetical protein
MGQACVDFGPQAAAVGIGRGEGRRVKRGMSTAMEKSSRVLPGKRELRGKRQLVYSANACGFVTSAESAALDVRVPECEVD